MKWEAYELPDGQWVATDLFTMLRCPDRETAESVARAKTKTNKRAEAQKEQR